MEFRYLGKSGLRVSTIGLGCNNFGGRLRLEETRAVLHQAHDLGIMLFDTSDTYGATGGGKTGDSEIQMGQVIGPMRHDIVLATKFGNPMVRDGTKQGGSRRYIMSAVEDSLRRLRTDYIDLYQIHTTDADTPIEETLRALDDLVRQGKIRYIGCSNHAAWRVVEAAWTARVCSLNRFISAQDEYSLVHRAPEVDLMPALRQYGMGMLPYFPLASGLLTGKYQRNAAMPAGARLTETQRLADRYLSEKNWTIAERLGDFAVQRGHTMLELAFAWLLAQAPVASVIAGATTPEQLAANATAGNWHISAEDLGEIDRIAAA
ncbi:MAG: aldo/keto reductase [Acetobacteraceae bacterium]|nr:aldo/keto reductase [Acetobacteraceae bacterium]MSP29718.1 aldo/keto reductase [Acetobacteraceae bacterium]